MFNIAFNTFRELIRNRILSLILFFGAILIAFSLVLASLSLGQTDRIVVDFGLAMIELCWLVSVVFVGGQILFKEFEGRTIYLILSKPIRRSSFIFGKFLGFSLVLTLLVSIESIIFLGLIWKQSGSIDPLIWVALISIFLKLLLVFGIILFFSTFTSSLLSILVTIGVYIAAHGASSMLDMAIRQGSASFSFFSKTLLVCLPNFEALNFAKNTLWTPIHLWFSIYAQTMSASVLYLALILILTAFIFEKKNFENA